MDPLDYASFEDWRASIGFMGKFTVGCQSCHWIEEHNFYVGDPFEPEPEWDVVESYHDVRGDPECLGWIEDFGFELMGEVFIPGAAHKDHWPRPTSFDN